MGVMDIFIHSFPYTCILFSADGGHLVLELLLLLNLCSVNLIFIVCNFYAVGYLFWI